MFRSGVVRVIKRRRPWLAAFFGFFIPGLGQWYCGRPRRAMIIAGAFIILLLLYVNVLLGAYPVMKFHWLLGIVVSFACAADAFILALGGRDFELKKLNRWFYYVGFSLSYALILGIMFMFSTAHLFRYQAWGVNGEGMAPTIVPGDKLVVDNWAYACERPRPGDLVMLQAPPDGKPVLERIVAVGEGELAYKYNAFYFNGVKIGDASARFSHWGDGEGLFPGVDSTVYSVVYRLGKDRVYVIGDNVRNSRDSRNFGPVPLSSVVGKVLYIYDSGDEKRAGKYFTALPSVRATVFNRGASPVSEW